MGILILKIMLRYFIIFYHARNSTHTSRGNVSATTNGEYISRQRTVKLIADKVEYFEAGDIVLTNIIELTEKEYNEWES